MKAILTFIIVLLLSAMVYSQNSIEATGKLEVTYSATSSSISYRVFGEIPQDGIAVIDLKEKALEVYAKKTQPEEKVLDVISKEKQSLELLRQRILVQRERMMKPLPAMQEVQ